MKKLILLLICLSLFVIQPVSATVDTVWVPLQDDSLFFILHQPTEIDTMVIMDFGYKKAGLGWVATFEHGYLEDAADSTNYDIPIVTYMQTFGHNGDVNQDGKVNLADLSELIRYLFQK